MVKDPGKGLQYSRGRINFKLGRNAGCSFGVLFLLRTLCWVRKKRLLIVVCFITAAARPYPVLSLILQDVQLDGMFNRKDIVRFLDEGFAKRLAGFMESCVEKYNETQEIQDFGWLYVGFYFRVCLMIASVLPRNSKDVISLCDKFELLWKEVPEAEHNFKFDVMIYHRDVFIFLFKTSFFSAYEQLLEFWLSKDRKACISFLTSTAIAPFDVQLNTEINHSLLVRIN